MADFFNKIMQGVETPSPVIKGGYGTAPSTPVQQIHTSGVWGTAIPTQEAPQQNQPSTENSPNPASNNNR